MIPERKGGCYMPEICNKIGSDILGGLEILSLNIPEFGAFSVFSPIFPPVPPKLGNPTPIKITFFRLRMNRVIISTKFQCGIFTSVVFMSV